MQRTHGLASRAGFALGLLFVVLFAAGGCYVYTPVPSLAPPGSTLALTLNDRARVALGDSIGPAAAVMEGRLQSESDTTYDLRVSRVGYLNRQANEWTGEPFTVRKEFVSSVQERRLSRSRTWLVVGGTVAGVVAFIASRGFGVLGSPGRDRGGGDGGEI